MWVLMLLCNVGTPRPRVPKRSTKMGNTEAVDIVFLIEVQMHGNDQFLRGKDETRC
jgi:hypothetical protein